MVPSVDPEQVTFVDDTSAFKAAGSVITSCGFKTIKQLICEASLILTSYVAGCRLIKVPDPDQDAPPSMEYS